MHDPIPPLDILRCIPVALCQRCARMLPTAEFGSHPDDGSLKCPVCPDAAGCDCDDCLDAVGHMLMGDWRKAGVPASLRPVGWSAREGLAVQGHRANETPTLLQCGVDGDAPKGGTP